MDIFVILGMVMWAVVVALLVGMLLSTGKAEDQSRSSTVERRSLEIESDASLSREDCYDICMKDFLWSPRKKVVCANACAL